MTQPLDYGDIIHGFAEGAFGRDHYDCVRVVEVGPDWIRAVTDDGIKVFAEGRSKLLRCQRARDEECIYNNEWTDRGECQFKDYEPLTTWRPR